VRHYVRNEDEMLPPVDCFNLGQKYYFWAMLYASIALLVSGLILWMPELIPWNLRALRSAAILVHVAAALITIGAFMIHVYMGVFAVPGGLSAIVFGRVPAIWAKTHHRLWYERIAGK
jgi:formate dehydrogenase subunit gamma